MNNRIDVYIDMNNRNNLWGMIYNKEIKHHIPKTKQELVHFDNYQAMVNYVNNYFIKQNIMYHFIDYGCIEYYYDNERPQINHVEIKYYEYIKNVRTPKKIVLPPEFESVFIDIIKKNKSISIYNNLDSRYHQVIDINEEEKKKRQEFKRTIKLTLDEFFAFAKEKVRNIKLNRVFVKKIALLGTVAVLASTIGEGYHLVKENNYHADFLKQDNPISSFSDLNVFFNKGNYGLVIKKLMKREYDGISDKDIKGTIEFINNIEKNNYDDNKSHNTIKFDGLEMEIDDYIGIGSVLNKIETLYNQAFSEKNDQYLLNEKGSKKYIDYVISLSILYDTYHDTRPSALQVNNQSIYSDFATSDEIKAFDRFPPILRYIILNQLKCMLSKSNYQMDKVPSYSFSEMNKVDLIGKVNQKIESCIMELYDNCKQEEDNKTI